jgi:hypothetical protein
MDELKHDHAGVPVTWERLRLTTMQAREATLIRVLELGVRPYLKAMMRQGEDNIWRPANAIST